MIARTIGVDEKSLQIENPANKRENEELPFELAKKAKYEKYFWYWLDRIGALVPTNPQNEILSTDEERKQFEQGTLVRDLVKCNL